MEERSLQSIFDDVLLRSHCGRDLPHRVLVKWDGHSHPRGACTGNEWVPVDLQESGATLIYRVVTQLIGYYRSGCGWRLLTGNLQLTINDSVSAARIGVCNYHTLTLVSRMRGGGDRDEEERLRERRD